LVGLGKGERLMGCPALNKIKRNFKNTVEFATRFLGDNASNPEDLKWLNNRVAKDEMGRTCFKVFCFVPFMNYYFKG
jgi:hypothetical protein